MIKILPYEPEFEEGIKALCRIPVSGNISLALEREPSYITGAYIQCEKPEVYVAVDNEIQKVWAVFNVGSRRLWYEKEIITVRYLCDLRIHPEKQQSAVLYQIIKKFREITAKDIFPAQTVVFADNYKMLAIIEKLSQRNTTVQLPYYHFVGGVITYMLGFNSQKPKGNLDIRRATADDIGDMQTFFDREGSKTNFYPYYNFKELNKSYYTGLEVSDFFLAFDREQLVGICGVWDQSDIKQTRIIGYSRLYRLIKPLYNLLTPFTGNIKLPAAGSVIQYLYLHSILIKSKNPDIFQQLINCIAFGYRDQGFDYLLCSLSESDKLTELLNSRRTTRKIKGKYYLVNDEKPIPHTFKNKGFYLEGARI